MVHVFVHTACRPCQTGITNMAEQVSCIQLLWISLAQTPHNMCSMCDYLLATGTRLLAPWAVGESDLTQTASLSLQSQLHQSQLSAHSCGMISFLFCIALPHGLANLPLTISLASWTGYFFMVPGILPFKLGFCRRAKLTSKLTFKRRTNQYNSL